MKSYNIHEAKTHLSRLIEMAERGEPFVIARAGTPVVTVQAITQKPSSRFDLLAGQFEVPADIDTPFKEDIEKMFFGAQPPHVSTRTK
jgi:prevent-host-death family protein